MPRETSQQCLARGEATCLIGREFPHDMDITIDDDAGVTVIRLNGALDARSAAGFRAQLSGLLSGGATHFVIDGTQLGFVDSIGLGTLVYLRRAARQAKGDVCIAAAGRELLEVLDFSGMGQVFQVLPDVSAARARFATPTA